MKKSEVLKEVPKIKEFIQEHFEENEQMLDTVDKLAEVMNNGKRN